MRQPKYIDESGRPIRSSRLPWWLRWFDCEPHYETALVGDRAVRELASSKPKSSS